MMPRFGSGWEAACHLQ